MNRHMGNIIKTVVKREKIKLFVMIVAILGSIVGALLPPLLLGDMIDTLSKRGEILFASAGLYFVTFSLAGILESLQNIMITVMGQKITHEMRSVMSQKLANLPADYFVKHETGKITSRFVNDVDVVDALFTNGIISMAVDGCKVVSIFVVIFLKSKGLGLLLCVVTPLIFWMTLVFQKRMKYAQIRNRKAVEKVNHHIPETIENIKMIQGYQGQAFMEKKYETYIDEGYEAMDESNIYDSIYSPIVIFISACVVAVMMICTSLGSSMQQFFGMSVGTTVAIIAYVSKVFDPLESLGMEIQNIQGALAGLSRMDEFLEEEEIKKQDVKAERKGAMVSLEHVSFGYEKDQEVISDMTFEIKQGEYVVFAGRTGAGKSTLFKLLLGLYEPCTGHVMVEGVDAALIPDKNRRELFGYVQQKFQVVDGSIKDQITLFDESISVDEVLDALDKCGLQSKIEQMPEGMDTVMREEDFSQGELQLLSIARAFVKKPKLMLLDEMTANLDVKTEQKILKTIQTVAKGRTVLSISHRMTEAVDGVRVISI